MPKMYIVRLTDAEREMLTGLLKKQRVAAQKRRRARIPLKADADGPNWTDAEIADAFNCRTRPVEKPRERLVSAGFIALPAIAGPPCQELGPAAYPLPHVRRRCPFRFWCVEPPCSARGFDWAGERFRPTRLVTAARPARPGRG